MSQNGSRQLQEQYRLAVEQSPNPIFLVDQHHQIQVWNHACTRLFQHDASIIGQSVSRLTVDAHTADLGTLVTQALQGTVFSNIEIPYRCRDGSTRLMISRLFPLHDANGDIQHCVVANTDITERQQAEIVLRHSEQQLRSLIQELGVGVVLYDSNLEILMTNQMALDLLDQSAEQLCTSQVPKHVDLIYQDGKPCSMASHPVKRVFRTKKPIRNLVVGVYRPTKRDRVWLLVNIVPLFNSTGQVQTVVCSFNNITAQRNAEAALRAERDLLNKIMNASVAAITVLDAEGHIIFANPSAEKVLGLSSSELRHRKYDAPEWKLTDLDGNPWPDRNQPFRHIMQTGETVEDVQHALEWPDGRRRYISVNGAPLRDESGRVSAAVFLITDITQRHLAEQALLDSETRFRLVAENMSDLVCLHQADGRYIYISPSCTALLGYEPEELIGHTPYELFHPDDREHIHHNVHSPILAGKATTPITYRIRRKQGDYIWVETLTKPIRDAQGQIIQLQTTSRDVTEKVQIQQQLEHDALHDALTQLPNRSQLMSRLELALERVKHHVDYSFTLLFWDLDHFKVVNDSLGHFVGDELLIQIAAVFQQAIRSVDLAVRLGGDEFVLLLEDETDAQAAIRVVQRIFAQLRSPFIVEGREVVVSASVGIVQGTAAYQNASELLRDADIAMYRAKARGRGRYEVFNPAMHQEALARLQLEQDLRQGIKQQEFQLCYQPIVSLSTGQVSGFEALIRWHHPQQGLVSPAQFIPIAEETGLITPLGLWILEEACRQLQTWRIYLPEAADLRVGVNLSVHQLYDPDELLAQIDHILHQTGLPGRCLMLEITEGMLIGDFEAAEQLLHELKKRSIQISIDDFGTGYSSLSYLHRLPIDRLKIDKSFIHQMQHSDRNHKIVETIITLADQLELDAIAEGIETTTQLAQLRQMNCEYGQGYFFARPLAATAVLPWLQSRLALKSAG